MHVVDTVLITLEPWADLPEAIAPNFNSHKSQQSSLLPYYIKFDNSYKNPLAVPGNCYTRYYSPSWLIPKSTREYFQPYLNFCRAKMDGESSAYIHFALHSNSSV